MRLLVAALVAAAALALPAAAGAHFYLRSDAQATLRARMDGPCGGSSLDAWRCNRDSEYASCYTTVGYHSWLCIGSYQETAIWYSTRTCSVWSTGWGGSARVEHGTVAYYHDSCHG